MANNANLRKAMIKSSDLPTYEKFQPHEPRKKPLTTAQQLVEDNKKRFAVAEMRRRNTIEVTRALLQSPVEIGAQIWIPDSERVWSKVQILSDEEDPSGMILLVRGNSEEKKIDLREIGDLYKVNPRIVDDMTGLYYIHEAGILHNLYLRSTKEPPRPYTFMANVLIAVNPLRRLVEPKIEDYIRTQMGDKPPHPYSIAEVAFQQMSLRTPAQCQSIVISGESGAGKTETSKIVLRYLTSREHVLSKDAWSDSSSELDRRLLDTNPILEAFGNAKTLRNHNSSRFGKFMKLQFSPDGKFSMVGAFIETYLLEKSRLVHQIPGERNFHVFYYLLAGLTAEQKSMYILNNVNNYHYLNQSGCISDPNVDDEILCDELVSALETIGITDSLQSQLFTILSGLLHLGNIELVNRESSEGDVAEISRTDSLEHASKLLGVNKEALEKVIRKREISTRGEVFTITRNAKEGGYVRDALAKSIYQHVFNWIVYKINKSLGHGPSTLPFIGVLDIFGFESFEYNDFEQLLINFANEALQATFNQQVFIAEQELFQKEGIDVGTILWPDNRDCIDLISGKGNGILQLLNDEAKTQKPSDSKWNSTMHKVHTGHNHFLTPHAKDKQHVFIIKHFATRVSYTIGNFIDKNNDSIPQDLEDFVTSSRSDLMKEVYQISSDASLVSTRSQSKKVSVSSKFQTQMNALVSTLDATRCNFIRCIKPNPSMTAGKFDHGYVVDQLRCTGMLATCELLKVGLPTRVSYAEICSIYKPVLPAKVTPMFEQYNDRTFTEAVLWSFRVDPDAYRLGRTRVFFKTGKIALLDALLKVDMKKMGPWIVARLKKWLARRRWRYATAKIIAQRAFLWLYDYTKNKKKAVIKLQSVFKMFQVRKKFIKKRNLKREEMRRKIIAQKRWKVAYRAIVAGNILKKLFNRIHHDHEQAKAKRITAAVKIQAITRGKLARNKANLLQIRLEEAAIRERLERERLEMEFKAKATAQRRWHKACYAIIAQNHFKKRFLHIHNAHVAAEAARREIEERRAAELALLEKQRVDSAVKIQALYRGYVGREDAKRFTASREAELAAAAAAVAAAEAAKAAALASDAHAMEAAALRDLDEDPILKFSSVGTTEGAALSGTLSGDYHAAGVAGQAGQIDAVGASGAIGSVGVAGALIDREESLQEADLSWVKEQGKVEGEGIAGNGEKDHDLAQAGRDLFGEGGEQPSGPLLEAEEENIVNPVEKIQEFPTGPPIPYKGGILTCTMLGHRKQQDQNWGDEYTEYVLRCTWGRDILEKSKTAWLVGGRYNDFNALHQELKAAASGKRGKRAPWYPRFPKRHPFSSMIGKNQEEKFIQKREKELNRYMTQVLTQMPDALLNIHMDRFLNLTLRTQDICEREAYAEARHRWEEEEREALANAADAEPLNDTELHEVEQLVHQLLEKIIYSQGDIRQDTQLQEMIHAVKVLQPRVSASAQIGAGVNMELVPLAMQLQDDIQDAFNQYNDTLIALRLGHDLS